MTRLLNEIFLVNNYIITHIYRWRPKVNIKCHFFNFFSSKFLRRDLSLNLELTDWLGWLASKLQGSSYFYLPSARIIGMYNHACLLLYPSARDLNSSYYPYVARSLLIKPSPQPQGTKFWSKNSYVLTSMLIHNLVSISRQPHVMHSFTAEGTER